MTDAGIPSPPASLSRGWAALLLGLCLLAYGWLFNWSERINNPNEMVRVHTVVALVEHGTYGIGRRTVSPGGEVRDGGLVRDRFGPVHDTALVCDGSGRPPACNGTLYAAKAPGLSLLGAPFYALERAVWHAMSRGEPPKPAVVWWLRLSCVVLPTVGAWLWLARHLTATLDHPRIGLAVVLAGALGSLSLTYGQMFAGHQPAGLALLLAFAAVVQAGRAGREGWVAVAGFGAGAAAAIEYPASVPGAALLAWLVLRRRRVADLAWCCTGTALPLGLLLHFHTVAFGAPWRLPYSFLSDPGFGEAQAAGLFGVSLPGRESIVGSLFSPYTGLYFFAPWTVLAWLGVAAVAWRRRTGNLWQGRRAEGLVAWLVCLYFLWLQASYHVWRGGWVVGPRHLTAMVPFAVIAAAHGLDGAPRWLRRLGSGLLAVLGPVSIAVTGLASAVSQGFPEGFYNPLREAAVPLLRHGFVAANPLMVLGVPGPWSGAPYFAALAAGAIWLVVLLVPKGPSPFGRALRLGAVVTVSASLFAGLYQVGEGRSPATDRELRRLMRDWWPPAPPGSRIPAEAGGRGLVGPQGLGGEGGVGRQLYGARSGGRRRSAAGGGRGPYVTYTQQVSTADACLCRDAISPRDRPPVRAEAPIGAKAPVRPNAATVGSGTRDAGE